MLEDFQKHINHNLSFLSTSKLLLAVSGGLDSMVLLHLCLQSKYDIVVAHCNFKLRDVASDADAAFVKAFCDANGITTYLKEFNTKKYAQDNGVSTQMAARDLRYDWFKELMAVQGFDHLLTAHHLNDDLETFLINFGRGTGLTGLTGIPEVNERTVRPLLTFSRKRIYQYAQNNQIQWREDASNASDDYLRNHLRHHAIPALEEAHPDVNIGFKKTQSYLKQSEKLLKVYDQQLRQQFTYPINSIQGSTGLAINLKLLAQYPEPNAVLYRLLSGYGFTAWTDVYDLKTAQTGKQVFSKTHRLLKNRETFEVYPIVKDMPERFLWQEGDTEFTGSFGVLSVQHVTVVESEGKDSIVVASDRIEFPLTIRRWKEGDYFYPFGMTGKKKLSKYFKDEKLSLVDKENVWLLCSAGEIVWVIGRRADDRFKVTQATPKMIRITRSYETKNS